MSPFKLTQKDVGRTLEIATKTKSRPIRGRIVSVTINGPTARVELAGTFGTRGHTLTGFDDVTLCA